MQLRISTSRTALAIAFMSFALCACSVRENSVVPPRAPAAVPPQPKASLRIADLDGGPAVQDPSGPVPIVNGSRIQISLNAPDAVAAFVQAGDESTALDPGRDGQWVAVLRYIDSSNPPAEHPVLQVTVRTKNGQRVVRIPVTELHQ